MTALWSSTLCPIDCFSKFHQRECLLGDYTNCGVLTLKLYPSEPNSKKLVTWQKINYVVMGKSSNGRDKVSRVEYCETTPSLLIPYLKPKLQEFVIHNFMWKWQEKKFKGFVPNLPLNTILYWIISLKTMPSKSKIWIGFHFKLWFLCISHIGSTQHMIQ